MATLKLDLRLRFIRAPWWQPLVAIGRVAIKCGVDEDRVVDAIAPIAGVVIITAGGRRSFYNLRRRDGALKLQRMFG